MGKKKSDPARELLSANLKKYRKAMGLSQDRFSEHIGMGHSMLAAIESMEKFPSPESLSRISKKLNLEVYELFLPEEMANSKELQELAVLKESLKTKLSTVLDEQFKDYITS